MSRAVCLATILVVLVASCGWTDRGAGIAQQNTITRLEAMTDPVGFERIGVEILNDGEFVRRYDGGYEVTWAANGDSPGMVLESFLPVLTEAGFVTETIDQTSCTEDRLRLFLIWETNFTSSSSLTYDRGDDMVRFQSNWDRRNQIDQVLGEVPTCT